MNFNLTKTKLSIYLRIFLVLSSMISSLFIGVQVTRGSSPLIAGFIIDKTSVTEKRVVVSNASGDNIASQGISLTNDNFQPSLTIVQDPNAPVYSYPIYCYVKDTSNNAVQNLCGNVVFPNRRLSVRKMGHS